MPSAPTVGIIGLGFGRAHIPGFQASGCQVIALCQRDRASAQKLADRYGVPQVYERWEELLDRAKPEVVVIATPPHLHHAIALRAFAAGTHVLCEKPLAMDLREAHAMVEAAARAKRIAMTGFNWRFPAAMQRFNAMVREGAVGRAFHITARWLGARWADESMAPTWRLDRTQAGHGAMGDVGVHLIDMVRWSFGDFTRVWAHTGLAYPSRTAPGGAKAADTDDFATVTAELASGAHVTLLVSRVARGATELAVEAYGASGGLAFRMDREAPGWWNGALRAAGTSGSFQPVAVAAASEAASDPPAPASDPPSPASDPMEIIGRTTIAPLVARMLDGIKTGQAPSPSLEDGLRAQAVLDAVIESAARGQWVTVQ